MKLTLLSKLLLVCGVALCISACSSGASAIQATPTPLPEDPGLTELTYTVAQGVIERVIEETARVVPVQSNTFSFGRDGVVSKIHVAIGDTITSGQLLAELKQDDVKNELRKASDDLDAANLAYTTAVKLNTKLIDAKRKAVANARDALNLLLPGGDKDVVQAAQKNLDDKQRAVRTTDEDTATAADDAVYGITTATNSLIDTQYDYSKAYWNLDWVHRYGTDPANPYIFVNGTYIPNLLDAEGKHSYEKAFASATDSLRSAEKAVQTAQRAAQRAKEDRQLKIDDATTAFEKARKERDKLLAGSDNADLRDARTTLEIAEAELASAMADTLSSEKKAVDAAKRAFEKAKQAVADGQIVATQAGTVASMAIFEGTNVTAFTPAIEVADPTKVEFSASLSPENMKLLSEGQSVEIRPVTRPDLVLSAVIRRLPAPYGQNGGVLGDPDQTTRFTVVDNKGFALVAGDTVAKVKIILERHENVLWLPPEAIRTFGERTFVVLREADQERRVTVVTGIHSDQQVEILKGLRLGDIVVGQ
jgi:multidrug efflux pump subunit AcrA (membrane-fusion protein)